MKKMLFGVFALSAAMILSACAPENNGDSSASSDPTPDTPSAGLPEAVKALEADGKMVLAFKLGTDEDKDALQDKASVTELPSFVSPYITGSFVAWGTAGDSVKLNAVEGAAGYYAAVIDWTYDPSAYTGTEEPLGYSIVLGYNESANLAADKTGLLWVDSYKSWECAQMPYPTNKTFEYKAGDKSIDLGTHHFTDVPAAPVVLHDYKYAWKFEQAIPSYVDIYMVGAFNGWDATFNPKYKLTRNDDGTWVGTLGDVIKNSVVEYKLVATNSKLSQDPNNFWSFVSNTIGDDTGANAVLTPLADDDYTDPTLTLEFAKLPGDPSVQEVKLTVNITISDYNSAATDYAKVQFNGSVNGWKAIDPTTVADKTLTYVFDSVAPGSYEFGLKVANDTGVQVKWVAGTDGKNVPITVNETDTTVNFTATIGDIAAEGNSNTIALAA